MGIGTGVAIVGMGCRLPSGVNSPEQYWDFMLRHGDWTVEAPAERWNAEVGKTLERATLTIPKVGYMQRGGREGKHTEHLGHMLAEMQIVARSHPGASW